MPTYKFTQPSLPAELPVEPAPAQLTDVIFTGCDLTAAEFSGTVNKHVDLRGSTLVSIHGIGGLASTTISTEQMIGLLPEFAAELGIVINDE